MTFDELFHELDQYPGRVPLDVLDGRLKDLEIDPAEIEPFVKFAPDCYRRNLMRAGPGYHALILCWKNGQRSPIHDHRGSSCGVKVIRGTATETVFDRTPAGHIYAVSSKKLREGYTCGTQDEDIHQISAIEPDGGDLVTLHIYSPPLLVMGTYSLTNTRVGNFSDPVFEFCEGAGI
jgi:cysteine dioxygenase